MPWGIGGRDAIRCAVHKCPPGVVDVEEVRAAVEEVRAVVEEVSVVGVVASSVVGAAVPVAAVVSSAVEPARLSSSSETTQGRTAGATTKHRNTNRRARRAIADTLQLNTNTAAGVPVQYRTIATSTVNKTYSNRSVSGS